MTNGELLISAGVEKLAKRRTEVRYVGTTEPSLLRDSSFREEIYPNTIVTSIYLGSKNLMPPFPERGSVRLRFRSEEIQSGKFIAFDPLQAVTLEVKLRSQKDETRDEKEKNRKYFVSDIPLESTLAILRDRNTFEQLDQFPNGKSVRRMLEVLFEGNGLDPLLMIQTNRRHFVKDIPDPVRMTLDADISYWVPTFDRCRFYDDGLFYALRTNVKGENILEIKTGNASASEEYYQRIIKELFGDGHDYIPAGRAKRSHGLYVIDNYQRPERINPEEKRMEGIREGPEREIKLDVAKNPQDIISEIPFNPISNVFLGPPKPSLVYFRYHILSNGQIVAQKSEDSDLVSSIFQTKQPVSHKGELVRYKHRSKGYEKLIEDYSVSQTAVGIRDRIERTVLCTNTGHLFVILADHCRAGDRDSLDQVEIEYLGTFGFPNLPVTQVNEDQIKHDFDRIANMVLETLKTESIEILPTKTTKEDWLTAKK